VTSGGICDEDVDECTSNPCESSHTLENGCAALDVVADAFSCNCTLGWVGQQCTIDADECSSYPCANGGGCAESGVDPAVAVNFYRCNCVTGWSSDNCEVDVDECATGACKNDAACTDSTTGSVRLGAFSCACRSGFSGGTCSVDVDECASQPCKHSSACTDGVDAYACVCRVGYQGENCAVDIDECANRPCRNRATCADSNGGTVPAGAFECTCRPGLQGDLCADDTDECISMPCRNGGTCMDSTSPVPTQNFTYSYVVPAVTEVATDGVDGTITYRLTVSLKGDAANVYTVYGTEENPLRMPAAYHEPAPFGSDIGGVSPTFFELSPTAEYDSWLTVGATDGLAAGELSATGIDFAMWADGPLTVADGALFWLEPDDGPRGADIVVAQLTLATGTERLLAATANLQGRGLDRSVDDTTGMVTGDWVETGVFFGLGGPASAGPTVTEYSKVSARTTQVATDGVIGTATFRLTVSLLDVTNLYTVYGTEENPLRMPAAYHEPAPFGTDIGGVSPTFFELSPTAEYDSWLTVGITEGALSGELSATGIDFATWADGPLTVVDGALFWLEPDDGPRGADIVVAQLTVAAGVTVTASLNLQGRGEDRTLHEETGLATGDWMETGVVFTLDGSAGAVGVPIDAFACACIEGLGGDDCSLDTDECASIPCANGATCAESSTVAGLDLGLYICDCAPGWTGWDCENDIDECLSNPCVHGECHSATGDEISVDAYRCDCDAGWSGENCNVDDDECASRPCRNGGTCSESSTSGSVRFGAFACLCVDGWAGSRDGGIHVDPPDAKSYSYVVPAVTEVAADGVIGTTTYRLTVSLLVDAPANVYTVYGTEENPLRMPAAYHEPAPFGSDIGGVSPTFFEFSPTAEYDSWLTVGITEGALSGELSATGINFAMWADGPLTVVDGALFWLEPDDGPRGADIVVAQLTLATGGWASLNLQGRGEERTVDDVAGISVGDWVETGVVFIMGELGDGTMTPAVAGNCAVDVNECVSTPCMNGAGCTESFVEPAVALDKYMCSCTEGYRMTDADDTLCRGDFDECVSIPCQNGATCSESSTDWAVTAGRFSCSCPTGFYSTADVEGTCDGNVDDCASNPCTNGAGCTDGADSFACACTAGFANGVCTRPFIAVYTAQCDVAGGICDVDVDECASIPCHGDVQCVDSSIDNSIGIDAYTCDCGTESGLTGQNCLEDVDECASLPCEHGALCTESSVAAAGKAFSARFWRVSGEGPSVGGSSPNWSWRVTELSMLGEDGSPLAGTIAPMSEIESHPATDAADGDWTTYWSPASNTGGEGLIQTFEFPTYVAAISLSVYSYHYAPAVLVVEASMDGRLWNPVIRYADFGASLTASTTFTSPTSQSLPDMYVPSEVRYSVADTCIPAPTGAVIHVQGRGITAAISLGDLSFPFYGEAYTEVKVSASGYVLFGQGQAFGTGFLDGRAGLPRETRDPLIAPYWTSILAAATVSVGYGDSATAIHFSSPAADWRVALHADGTFAIALDRTIGAVVDRHGDIGWKNVGWMSARGAGVVCRAPGTTDCQYSDYLALVAPISEPDVYHCSCRSGFAGDNCADDIDDCVSGPCENGAACEDRIDAYSCACLEGWGGDNCGDAVDPCERGEDDCDATAACVHFGPGVHTCRCDDGYEEFQMSGQGLVCVDADECKSSPCVNGALSVCLQDTRAADDCDFGAFANNTSCTDSTGDPTIPLDKYVCNCPPGLTGDNCDVSLNECASHPCSEKTGALTRCIDLIDGYRCDCPAGWGGENCEEDVDECASEPCINGVGDQPSDACQDLSQQEGLPKRYDAYFCTCVKGWEGDNCADDVDECHSIPCLNGGACLGIGVQIDSYACNCTAGLAGENCAEDVDECASEPCINGADCVDSRVNPDEVPKDSYRCTCRAGFANGFCAYDFISEYAAECSVTHSAAAPADNSPICDINVNECASDPCVHGTCADDNSNDNVGAGVYVCTCTAGWTGENCAEDLDECASAPCLNDGKCTDSTSPESSIAIDAYLCECIAGTEGNQCQIDTDECSSAPCQNSGLCFDSTEIPLGVCKSPEGVPLDKVVLRNGYFYASLDFRSPSTCGDTVTQYTYLELPEKWEIAPSGCDASFDLWLTGPAAGVRPDVCPNTYSFQNDDAFAVFSENCFSANSATTKTVAYKRTGAGCCVCGECPGTDPEACDEGTAIGAHHARKFRNRKTYTTVTPPLGVSLAIRSGDVERNPCWPTTNDYGANNGDVIGRSATEVSLESPWVAIEDPDRPGFWKPDGGDVVMIRRPACDLGDVSDAPGCEVSQHCYADHVSAAETASIEAAVPFPHTIDWDGNADGQIVDGGRDMFDGGNKMTTSLCADSRIAPYTDEYVTTDSECFGEGGSYRMDMQTSSMVLEATNEHNHPIDFMVSGVLGADGFGRSEHWEFTAANLKIFGSTVCGTSDPAISKMFVIDRDASPDAHYHRRNSTAVDDEALKNIYPGGAFSYMLYASVGGHCPTIVQHKEVFRVAFGCISECGIDFDQYRCECPFGLGGHDCELDLDECLLDNPCLNRATCTDSHDTAAIGVGETRCECLLEPVTVFGDPVMKTGWQGELCDYPIDECNSSPCQNEGTCADVHLGYNCTCPFGYSGENCEEFVDVCETGENDCLLPTVVYGQFRNITNCTNIGPGIHECICLAGWAGDGKDADITPGSTGCADINECESHPCQNGATCSDSTVNNEDGVPHSLPPLRNGVRGLTTSCAHSARSLTQHLAAQSRSMRINVRAPRDTRTAGASTSSSPSTWRSAWSCTRRSCRPDWVATAISTSMSARAVRAETTGTARPRGTPRMTTCATAPSGLLAASATWISSGGIRASLGSAKS
jgi:hypothetical protein